MPEPTGCHPPEVRGTDYPNLGCQAPVDNFSRLTSISINLDCRAFPCPPRIWGTKCPSYPFRWRERSLREARLTAGVLNARIARASGRGLTGQGVPSARTLLPDGFDLMGDLRNWRLGREKYQAAEHRLDPGIGVNGED